MNRNLFTHVRGWKLIAFFLFGLLFNSKVGCAQDPFPVSSLGVTVNSQGSQMNLVAHIIISDTISVSKIHVRIGTQPILGDIATLEFPFDGSVIPQGTQYTRNGNAITISLGQYPALGLFFYEAQAEYNSINTVTGSTLSFVTAEVYRE